MRKTLVNSQAIVLGATGENDANKVLFPVRGWKELYDTAGYFKLIHQRPTDDSPTERTITLNGEFVEWVIKSWDVAVAGRGKVQLAFYNSDDLRVKTFTCDTIIRDSLGNNSIEPPEPWQSWVDEVMDSVALPDVPTTDGTYTLKVVVENGVAVKAWVSEE